MPKQKIDSIEQLARFSAEEFGTVSTRMDKLDRKVDQGVLEMRAGFRALTEILDSVLHEVRRIGITDLEKRVERLERHAGLVK
ncbi:hypothetical protein A2765_00295 [Candidatus Kaiserbacteria bacterium RIFCSPHIGHO2_01_FULL_56_24]|uniref:Uncharacterized protein n=1 Tax=Candidatus Kaiserbacteria bacterium RIFCSPHIGHO2_01_FULL_56_24 TaxID=1798487 RepID=A0A1F6DGQ9_9BACT|nr:MAG: hypothetical protein A2765_00295 [Candidatus Kaiserbacteria bacterium RIFCSPHIGHO2_01_FULL_56_24]